MLRLKNRASFLCEGKRSEIQDMMVKKKHQIIFFAARNVIGLLTMGAIDLLPVTMNASILWTHHDFYSDTLLKQQYSTELCNVCHTPHNADNTTVKPSPLWNHKVTATNYSSLYSSPTLNAVPTQPTSISKLCLSCHDGTVAVDSFGVKIGENYVSTKSWPYAIQIAIGTNLSNHHPVSIRYDSALAAKNPKLKNPDTSLSGLGGTISHDLLNGGVLECSSCHDVHVARIPKGSESCMSANACHSDSFSSTDFLNTKSLVKSNNGSALCFTCHDK